MLICSIKTTIFGMAAAIEVTNCLCLWYSNNIPHYPCFLQEQESSLEITGNTIPESFQSFIMPLNHAVLLGGITSDLLSLPRVSGGSRTFTWFLTAPWSLFHKSIVKCKSSVCAKNIYSNYIFRKMTTIWIDGLTGSTVWWTWTRTPFINQTA